MGALDYIKNLDRTVFDSHNDYGYIAKAEKGLSKSLVRRISKEKKEPIWMLEHRLKALGIFYQKELPTWGVDLGGINFEEIIYYVSPKGMKGYATKWEEVPKEIKQTFERLGIPEAERKFLAGTGAQYDSLNAYHKLKEQWEGKGVIFEDMDMALKKYPELVKKYFMKCVPSSDHKFAALHGAVWSGGTFLYIPKGVNVTQPLQAYFRMNAKSMGQFEHTLIIVEEGAKGHYIEGCSAPKYGSTSLHAGCVEIFVGSNAHFRYSSVENWSQDTYNLNTKRAIVDTLATMEWVGGNLGSGHTMLYPCSILKGRGARADHLGVAFANRGQIQDTGAKVIHVAPDTSSTVLAKGISKGGGVSVYRGLLQINKGAVRAKANIRCDALILDQESRNDTFPKMKIYESDVAIAHEARVGKISEEQLFYLRSRGLSENEALGMIVNGFIEPIVKALPLEYAVEMNRLIEMEMEGVIG
ncbi:MAG: FeS assembly protein SufB, Fe-S cluster assembly protein SufB [Candidatus Peregrinibacteria bacterium GW2011_GWE2_39_6]|nr:MAG: FeS assembly protein SufB, Fe-S cluster assembly protein SufB [Candidatus Peregrinibacteria bacterium GW2011_GWF2_39_17]KKR26435.1 MAG: FeS assembly protein SufB, Fe-S cluster assembly protein SufB [Candidatus Peregrinibacteria bacterium GW2011_GWE2_39_6]HCW32186.1 Fe-S cluster assembly protein SufB [Candidatus Peregrinibacteria bacterium]